MLVRSTSLLILLSTLIISIEVHATQCRPWQQNDRLNKNLLIGKISIEIGNVYDKSNTEENYWYHRAANKLHIITRQKVIQRQLLFSSGDHFNERILLETERLLRANSYIKNALITPVEVCNNTVNINVKTNDSWSLTPGFSFDRTGGTNRYSIDIEENNLLGYGKDIHFGTSQTIDRDERMLSYTDTQLWGSRKRLYLAIEDNSDGKGYAVDLSLPFYQLNSKRSWGTTITNNKKETAIYQNGSIVRKFGEDKDFASIFYGWSHGNINNTTTRYKFGWAYEDNNYLPVAPYNITLAARTLSYPWTELEFFEEKYVRKTNLSTMGTIEDISLGHHFKFKAGLINKSLGSDDNYLFLSSSYNKGFQPASNQLGLISLGISSFVGNGLLEGVRVKGEAEWHYLLSKRNHFYLAGKFETASNLQAEEQIILGEETGLRGYPVRYQSGNKSFLISMEHRHFYNWYPFRTVKLASAVFADVGSAWGQGNKQKILADAGFGFRFVITRSSIAKVLHLDFTFPIDAPANIDDVQVNFKTKGSF